jgi:hypothetical protein
MLIGPRGSEQPARKTAVRRAMATGREFIGESFCAGSRDPRTTELCKHTDG